MMRCWMALKPYRLRQRGWLHQWIRSLTVTDSENLTVFIDVASISELGGLTLGRVSRSNTDTASAIVVNLQSSDTSEATVPASVVIPAGQAIANFLISAVDDTLLDGTQTVTITASLSVISAAASR